MDKKYIELFKSLAQATATSAETVMEYDREKNDEKGLETATTMRDDFQALTDKISTSGENYTMDKVDAARLLIGAMIQINQLQSRIENLKKAMTGYQTDVIPKLQNIVDAEDDITAGNLANEKFTILNEEQN